MKKSYCTHFTNVLFILPIIFFVHTYFSKIKNEKFCNLLKEKTNVKTCEGLCNPPLLSPELWLCLECCFIACGRYENKCSLVHFKNTTHYLNINLKSLKIW